MNHSLEGSRRIQSRANLRYFPGISLKVLTTNMKSHRIFYIKVEIREREFPEQKLETFCSKLGNEMNKEQILWNTFNNEQMVVAWLVKKCLHTLCNPQVRHHIHTVCHCTRIHSVHAHTLVLKRIYSDLYCRLKPSSNNFPLGLPSLSFFIFSYFE